MRIMIGNVNFQGKLFLAGSTEYLAKKPEVKKMQEYANKNECDIVVCNRDYYAGGKGKYTTLLFKEDKGTGVNQATKRIFDFQHPHQSGNFDIEI